MQFLAFEGLDGAGKSTLIQGLKRELEGRGQSVVVTREPGGTRLGDTLRQILLAVDGDAPVPRAEALLYQAIRAQHVDRLIKPSLAAGHWVLSDRYQASSIAFQSGGRDIGENDIEWLNRFSTGGLKPSLNVLLDLPVDESLLRLNNRGQEPDRFERENSEFHERVRGAYQRLATREPNDWMTLSSLSTPAEILQSLLNELKKRKWIS